MSWKRHKLPPTEEVLADCLREKDRYEEKTEYLLDEMISELAIRHHMTEIQIKEVLDDL